MTLEGTNTILDASSAFVHSRGSSISQRCRRLRATRMHANLGHHLMSIANFLLNEKMSRKEYSIEDLLKILWSCVFICDVNVNRYTYESEP